MKRYLINIIFFICMCLICPLKVYAEADFRVQKTINMEKTPLDVAVSERSLTLYVLTTGGIVYVYNSNGILKGQIEVGKHIDGIAPGPSEDYLILISKEKKTVQKILIEFMYNINIEGSPFKGKADAPIVIIVFTDYQCPACSRLAPVLSQVVEKNKDTVKFVIKNLPLPTHRNARNAAAAAITADSMGKFWELHEELYKNLRDLSIEKLREIAAKLGLDPDEFEKEMRSQKIQKKIDQDMEDAEKAEVTGTPAVFINGKQYKKSTVEGLQKAIDEQLKKLK